MIHTLHYISQHSTANGHIENISQACEAGCRWIQLRIKQETQEQVLPVAEAVKKICDSYGAALIINDYPAIAVAVGAAGVHVGKNDMTVKAARAVTGPDMIVGGTANTTEDILQHVADGASYVGVGPYRFTSTKQNLSPILGLEGYQRILQELRQQRISIPVIAIGGIQEEDIPALLETGVHGVAVSGLISGAADKSATVQRIYELVNRQTIWNH
ncbi:thiamine phosphate synthase [Chitinophaga sp. Mgbs1]|uniref:Thiamine-phosphate synthase n=1 Tax=Chitinophaga solisilvae TaxID=1233460 RepID=A0A3S1DSX2_9BACT|nr:thiamine phosphate synthase [Chitinophaga solisilvae]